MKTMLNMLLFAVLALVLGSAPALAQDPQGAEARLKQKNITLPPEAAPMPITSMLFALATCSFLPVTPPVRGGSPMERLERISR
jgi:hypothetical protein